MSYSFKPASFFPSIPKNLSAQLLTFLAVTMIHLPGILRASEPLTPGSPAPQLTAIDQDGNSISLPELYKTGTVLVYFYPKADTPGCTAQACSLRDDIEELSSLGVTVVGVSKDTPEAQKKFQEKYNLPFSLIADESGEVATAFGVGALLGFSNRSSFLIQDGKVAWIAAKAKTGQHAEEVKEALKQLESSRQ